MKISTLLAAIGGVGLGILPTKSQDHVLDQGQAREYIKQIASVPSPK